MRKSLCLTENISLIFHNAYCFNQGMYVVRLENKHEDKQKYLYWVAAWASL